ncbi:MAG: linear amide C-N hydrolase [Lachnospiraceae bacterium]|jgi:predicted choloylglycine hydrolase|nr:linear amide C-N hydrolase [Lachnospiraceae bacterium]
MKKIIKRIILSVLAVIALAVIVFTGIYFTRIQTIRSIKKLTNYGSGYNLYRMDCRYDYNLDDIINYGIHDNQSMSNAIIKETLPLLPVHIKTPPYGCTAFTLVDADGNVRMGRNYDFKNSTSSMMVCCTPKNGYRSIAFAALDNISANDPNKSIKNKLSSLTAPFICLDGINEKGVSIAVLALDSEPTLQNTGKPVISTTLAIRLVLDRAATTEEAVALLKNYDMFASGGHDYHFYVTDASGDGRVIEYDCESPTRELVAIPTVAVTNFYILYKEKAYSNQENGLYGHGMKRYEAVLDVFKKQRDNYTNYTAWNALKAAAQYPDPNKVKSNTQWSIVYDNTNLTAEVVIRRNWNDAAVYGLQKIR